MPLKIQNMMATHQKRITVASSIGFTLPGNLAERYSSKKRSRFFQNATCAERIQKKEISVSI